MFESLESQEPISSELLMFDLSGKRRHLYDTLGEEGLKQVEQNEVCRDNMEMGRS